VREGKGWEMPKEEMGVVGMGEGVGRLREERVCLCEPRKRKMISLRRLMGREKSWTNKRVRGSMSEAMRGPSVGMKE